jgi:hypothetical protein
MAAYTQYKKNKNISLLSSLSKLPTAAIVKEKI